MCEPIRLSRSITDRTSYHKCQTLNALNLKGDLHLTPSYSHTAESFFMIMKIEETTTKLTFRSFDFETISPWQYQRKYTEKSKEIMDTDVRVKRSLKKIVSGMSFALLRKWSNWEIFRSNQEASNSWFSTGYMLHISAYDKGIPVIQLYGLLNSNICFNWNLPPLHEFEHSDIVNISLASFLGPYCKLQNLFLLKLLAHAIWAWALKLGQKKLVHN